MGGAPPPPPLTPQSSPQSVSCVLLPTGSGQSGECVWRRGFFFAFLVLFSLFSVALRPRLASFSFHAHWRALPTLHAAALTPTNGARRRRRRCPGRARIRADRRRGRVRRGAAVRQVSVDAGAWRDGGAVSVGEGAEAGGRSQRIAAPSRPNPPHHPHRFTLATPLSPPTPLVLTWPRPSRGAPAPAPGGSTTAADGVTRDHKAVTWASRDGPR